ncbi:hypothetical protein QBC36DRAFT_385057 [Triangularia setosa]|uniref:Uncharacterized protein n=1 Tax=Triangularia setosa TaxID=2587417 RepID=A0AAN7A8T9_9PEZI|nr:hypothetical protein QBC36DRAFT_385057 [Podospora setosa]
MACFWDLLLELVTKIVKDLCWCKDSLPDDQCHCLKTSCETHSDRECAFESDCETLAALCLTSKLLNTRASYHYLSDLGSDSQLSLLLRTLVTCQDFSQHVRSLDMKVETYFQGQVENLKARRAETGERPPITCRTGTMTNLKKAVLEWYDTESGMGLGGLGKLLHAAPNIETIIITPLSQDDDEKLDGLTLAKLTYLELRRSLVGAGALVSIFKLCPNLEIFKYEIGDHYISNEQKLKVLTVETSSDQWNGVTLMDQNAHSDALAELEIAVKAQGIERSFPLSS